MRKSKLMICALVGAVALTKAKAVTPVYAGDNETEVSSGVYTTDNIDLYVWDNDTKDLIVSNDSEKYPNAVLVTEKKLNKIKESTYNGTWENALPSNTSFYLKEYQHLVSADFSAADFTATTDMNYMFSYCPGKNSLKTIDLSGANTSNVKDMSGLFSDCMSLQELKTSDINTSSVTNMDYMFSGCTNIKNIDVSSFNTSKVTSMSGMFSGCSNISSLDLSNFDTANVNAYDNMLSGCNSLTSLDLSSFTIKEGASTSMFNWLTDYKKLDTIKAPKLINSVLSLPPAGGVAESNKNYYNETDTADSTIYTALSSSQAGKTFRRTRKFTINVTKDNQKYKTITVDNCRIGQQINISDLDIDDISEYNLIGSGIYTVNADVDKNTATADYESKTFTVRFLNYDGTELKTETVKIHGSATAPDAPTRAEDSRHTYTFSKWNKDFMDITADTDITAEYTVTIKAEDLGDTLDIIKYILLAVAGAGIIVTEKKRQLKRY